MIQGSPLEMLSTIYHIYSDIKNKEETNTDLLLTIISDNKDMNNFSKTTVNSHEITRTNFLYA